jgi:hypothetical protein
MSKHTTTPPVAEPPPGGIPEEVEVLPGNQVRPPPERPGHEVKKSREMAQQVATDFVEALFSDKNDLLLVVLLLIVQFLLLRLGVTQGLEALSHPHNARLLLPALDAMLKAAPTFAGDAPLLMRELKPEETRRRMDRLGFLYQVQEALKPLNEGLEALVTHLEQGLEVRAREFMSQGKATLGEPFAEHRGLAVAHEWYAGAAEQGQDTKKANARLVAKTTEETVASVVEQLKKAAAANPSAKVEDLIKELLAKKPDRK